MMRTFGVLCFSLLMAAPVFASDKNLEKEFEKVAKNYEQAFNKQDAAGITALFTKDHLRVVPSGIVDNTKYYEGAFKNGVNHLEIKTTEVQAVGKDEALRTGEARVTGKNDKGEPIDFEVLWTSFDVKENGEWKIRMLTSFPKPAPAK